MKKVLITIAVVFGIFLCSMQGKAQVSPVSNLNDKNTAVVNDNMNYLQGAVNVVKGTVTLLNQYFTSGILNSSAGGTQSNLTACTKGSIPYFTSTGKMACLAPTATGDTLVSNGSNANPSFNTIAIPIGYNLVSVTSLSATTNSGDIAINPAKQYKVVLQVSVVATAALVPTILLNNDTTGGHYKYVFRGFNASATAYNGNSTSDAGMVLGAMSGAGSLPNTLELNISPQGLASTKDVIVKGSSWSYGQNGTGQPGYFDFMGMWTASTTVASFRITGGGGGATMTGNVYLYELKTSS